MSERSAVSVQIVWDPAGGSLRFVEVKGRIAGADTVTKNAILMALNKPGEFIRALVAVPASQAFTGDGLAIREPHAAFAADARCRVRYVRTRFQWEPDFG